jgi:hypothetical protein
VAALREIETDEELSPELLAAIWQTNDRFREAEGLPPLADGRDLPEEEFYRRARALGLRRSRG